MPPLVLPSTSYNDADLITNFDDADSQLAQFYSNFQTDFVLNPFTVNGKALNVHPNLSKIKPFNKFPESFVHIITRKVRSTRSYECIRANRINWIRPILTYGASKSIRFYKWQDDDGMCNDHYWVFDKNYMVVLHDWGEYYKIVSAFCVDSYERINFLTRYDDYQNGRGC
jgi:hypothetical protein